MTVLDRQIGVKAETTYGTYAAPDRFFEYRAPTNLAFHRERAWSQGVRKGRFTKHRAKLAKQWVDGGFTIEAAAQEQALLWTHVLGAVNTTGAGPYTHTITPGTSKGKSLTIQVAKPEIDDSTIDKASYLGCKLVKGVLSASLDDYVTAQFDVLGAHEDTSTALAAASYPAALDPFVFTEAVVQLAGTEIPVRSFTFTVDTQRRHRWAMGATNPERPLEPVNAMLATTCTIDSDYNASTDYARLAAGTEATLSIALTAGTHSLTVTANMETVEAERKEEDDPLLTLSTESLHATADASALTIVVVNGDSAA